MYPGGDPGCDGFEYVLRELRGNACFAAIADEALEKGRGKGFILAEMAKPDNRSALVSCVREHRICFDWVERNLEPLLSYPVLVDFVLALYDEKLSPDEQRMYDSYGFDLLGHRLMDRRKEAVGLVPRLASYPLDESSLCRLSGLRYRAYSDAKDARTEIDAVDAGFSRLPLPPVDPSRLIDAGRQALRGRPEVGMALFERAGYSPTRQELLDAVFRFRGSWDLSKGETVQEKLVDCFCEHSNPQDYLEGMRFLMERVGDTDLLVAIATGFEKKSEYRRAVDFFFSAGKPDEIIRIAQKLPYKAEYGMSSINGSWTEVSEEGYSACVYAYELVKDRLKPEQLARYEQLKARGSVGAGLSGPRIIGTSGIVR